MGCPSLCCDTWNGYLERPLCFIVSHENWLKEFGEVALIGGWAEVAFEGSSPGSSSPPISKSSARGDDREHEYVIA
jgi:hypothetical protein